MAEETERTVEQTSAPDAAEQTSAPDAAETDAPENAAESATTSAPGTAPASADSATVAAKTGRTRPSRPAGGRLLWTARALLAAAVLAAGWSAWSWHAVASAGPPAAQRLRDHVLQAAEQAVLNVSSLDYRHLAQGIRQWKQSSAGSFLAGIVAGQSQLERAVMRAKTVTTARILDGALITLQVRAGLATFIVAEQTTVSTGQGTPAVTQYRLEGQLIRTRSGWKLSELRVVPTGSAAAGTSSGPGR